MVEKILSFRGMFKPIRTHKKSVIPWPDHGIQVESLLLCAQRAYYLGSGVKPQNDKEEKQIIFVIPACAGMTNVI